MLDPVGNDIEVFRHTFTAVSIFLTVWSIGRQKVITWPPIRITQPIDLVEASSFWHADCGIRLPQMKEVQEMRKVLAILLLTSAFQAHAGIIGLSLSFADPAWSASGSYDDTTGQAWSVPVMTAYSLTSLSVNNGAINWDLSEVTLGFPPFGGVIVDPVGTVALFIQASDTTTGAIILSQIGITGLSTPSPTITSQNLLCFIGCTNSSSYTATAVPEPGALSLLGVGLLGLALARRRIRS